MLMMMVVVVMVVMMVIGRIYRCQGHHIVDRTLLYASPVYASPVYAFASSSINIRN